MENLFSNTDSTMSSATTRPETRGKPTYLIREVTSRVTDVKAALPSVPSDHTLSKKIYLFLPAPLWKHFVFIRTGSKIRDVLQLVEVPVGGVQMREIHEQILEDSSQQNSREDTEDSGFAANNSDGDDVVYEERWDSHFISIMVFRYRSIGIR